MFFERMVGCDPAFHDMKNRQLIEKDHLPAIDSPVM